MIKNLKTFLGIRDFHDLGCFFKYWGHCTGQESLLAAFLQEENVEKTRYCDVNLVQPRVLCLYYVLKGLEAGGYKSVAEDDLSHSQLPIGVDKNFGLEYPRQVGLIDEIKV